MLPLQFGLPGVTELFVILLILVLLAVPVVLVIGVVLFVIRRGSDESEAEERIAELEQEVEQLRKQQGDEVTDTADTDSDVAGDSTEN